MDKPATPDQGQKREIRREQIVEVACREERGEERDYARARESRGERVHAALFIPRSAV